MVQPNLDPTYALAKDISDAQARIGRLEQADITIAGLHDVTVTSQTQGQALTWDATAKKWVNSTPASTLAGLTDVSLTSPTNAQVLTYNSALSKWINATGGGGGSFTVSATAPSSPTNGAGWYNLSNGLIFFYINDGDSSQWVQDTSIANDAGYDSRITALETFNTVAQPVAVGGTGASSLTAGGYLKGNGSSAVTSQVGIPGSDIVGYMSPNYIINGAFDIWQRGTTGTIGATTTGYPSADRFKVYSSGAAAPALTLAQSTDVPTGVGVSYSGAFSWSASTSTGDVILGQFIENGKYLFAGKTVTVSFYAKATSAIIVNSVFDQDYANNPQNITTSWARYQYTVTLPSTYQSAPPSGSSTGNNTEIRLIRLTSTSSAANTIYVTGVQVEVAGVASAFRRNANSIQGELAACQRYYQRYQPGTSGVISIISAMQLGANTNWNAVHSLPVEMRIVPTANQLNMDISDNWTYNTPLTAFAVVTGASKSSILLSGTNAASGATFRPAFIRTQGASSYVEYSAEL